MLACGRPVAKPVERVRRQVVRKPAAVPAPLLDCRAEGSSGGASGAEVAAAGGCGPATSGAEVASGNGAGLATSGAEVKSASSPAPTPTSAAEALSLPTTDPAPNRTSATEAATAAEAAAETETEERVSLSFSLTADDYESFEQAKAILARKLPADMSLEDAFNELVAFYLAKKEPTGKPKSGKRQKSSGTTKHPRSEESSAQGQANRSTNGTDTNVAVSGQNGSGACADNGGEAVTGTGAASGNEESHRPTTEPRSRHIPAETRATVFERDGHRCSFVAADGTRCRATRNLQIDHVQPFALGGSNEPQNLRVLCAAHNRRAAEHVFGPLPRRKSQRDRR
jgi:hypothetical protein